ncbi:DUF255 domain-containing protein [Planctomicrobium sp. SH661]|uniref:thioredoxin domain-containing protein n=1 Tax=Planctomicrobium sp. SH661 TaxID=3448124 RepID=UPI003F5AEC60
MLRKDRDLVASFSGRFAFLLMLVIATSSAHGQILPGPKPQSSSKDFGGKQNHLAREGSPYLRQHADNPVEWYPWGPEALQKALKENKPIFLSIGYSTCFWCHVMERQVFENKEIAAYMNEHFVNIKVDREERPDLDDVYMTSLQVYFQLARSSQGGGWPLSMFLTPEGRPIAGGTYFPPEEMPGQTSFPTVLRQIQNAWATREKDVRATADLITREVARLSAPAVTLTPVHLGPELVTAAVGSVQQSYDPQEGGLDFDPQAPEGPKFPVPCRLQLLQSQIGRPLAEGEKDSAAMLDHTLTRMAAGGIRDHLGGGFHRYSTDRRWHVPHFEKMLYDNAQLAEIYAEAYRRTGRDQYKQIAEEIFGFVKQELTGANGQFYSALDAETDGVEGAYYLWSKPELEKVLSASNLRLFATAYGTEVPGESSGIVLRMPMSFPDTAETLGLPMGELELRLAEMRKQLLEVRRQRTPLRKDDKVLTGWNGLMIRAYARAGQIFKRQDYLDSASKAAVYLLAEHMDPKGGLLRTDAGPSEQQPAFLEDYAFLISGLLALYEATHEDKWLSAARRLMDDQISGFWDQKQGGFYFTANRQETVLARIKSARDSEIPSGNSVSAQNLVRLSRLKGDETYRNYAQKTFAAFGQQLQTDPSQYPYLAMALQEYLHWYGAPKSQAAGDGLFSGGLSRPVREPAMPSGNNQAPANFTFPDRTGTVAVLTAAAGENGSSQHVIARGFLDKDALTPGGECRFIIEVVVENGWHLNANPPSPEFVIPLEVSVAGNSGVQLKDVKYPAGKAFTVKGIEESLSVYEGTVLVSGVLVLPEIAAETIALNLDVQLQTCNERNCLPRSIMRLSGSIPVATAEKPAQPVNASIFQNSEEK